jgi:hypothetical protein
VAPSPFPPARIPRELGQAVPLVLGAALTVVFCALLLVALGGAVTGKARAQRVADLAAISAARSMRDDHSRLFVPARLPDGRPNPRHLQPSHYLERAAAAAREAARRNGADPGRLRVSFPDRGSFAPLRVRVAVVSELTPAVTPASGRARAGARGRRARSLDGSRPRTRVRSVEIESAAEATLSSSAEAEFIDGSPRAVSGDEYAGPLAYRQGRPMRPDVARAFDRLAAAARSAGISLVVSSAYRSNAEQARLFERNPDPRWVAPPGRSLHRCGTELDLGPASAYGWLAANASRFGFVRRYSWEPWHFGFVAGSPPCSAAADRIERGGPGGSGSSGRLAGGAASAGGRSGHGGDGRLAAAGLPDYVPARFRPAIARAASRHDVSAALLAAQLLAESNFNPFAVSHAGAQGIAQFMPGTAAAYNLRDPFDPIASIDAQARLMSDLLRRFGSVALALAAYNAGPAPVSACTCVPPYAETQAYVAKILGLLDGAGELAAPALEVRLVS